MKQPSVRLEQPPVRLDQHPMVYLGMCPQLLHERSLLPQVKQPQRHIMQQHSLTSQMRLIRPVSWRHMNTWVSHQNLQAMTRLRERSLLLQAWCKLIVSPNQNRNNRRTHLTVRTAEDTSKPRGSWYDRPEHKPNIRYPTFLLPHNPPIERSLAKDSQSLFNPYYQDGDGHDI